MSHEPIGEQDLFAIKAKVKEILDGTADIQEMEVAITTITNGKHVWFSYFDTCLTSSLA